MQSIKQYVIGFIYYLLNPYLAEYKYQKIQLNTIIDNPKDIAELIEVLKKHVEVLERRVTRLEGENKLLKNKITRLVDEKLAKKYLEIGTIFTDKGRISPAVQPFPWNVAILSVIASLMFAIIVK